MKKLTTQLKILLGLNILSLLLLGFYIAINSAQTAKTAGYGLIVLVPIVWPVWGITIIGDLIGLPVMARWLVNSPRIKKWPKFIYFGLLIGLLLLLGYFVRKQFTSE